VSLTTAELPQLHQDLTDAVVRERLAEAARRFREARAAA
jgi:hypothetical protein